MTDVLLSCSRNAMDGAVNLRGRLARCGLSVFKDDESVRAGDLWLDRPQDAVIVLDPDTTCTNV